MTRSFFPKSEVIGWLSQRSYQDYSDVESHHRSCYNPLVAIPDSIRDCSYFVKSLVQTKARLRGSAPFHLYEVLGHSAPSRRYRFRINSRQAIMLLTLTPKSNECLSVVIQCPPAPSRRTNLVQMLPAHQPSPPPSLPSFTVKGSSPRSLISFFNRPKSSSPSTATAELDGFFLAAPTLTLPFRTIPSHDVNAAHRAPQIRLRPRPSGMHQLNKM